MVCLHCGSIYTHQLDFGRMYECRTCGKQTTEQDLIEMGRDNFPGKNKPMTKEEIEKIEAQLFLKNLENI